MSSRTRLKPAVNGVGGCRFIDLGECDAAQFHATYSGLALAQASDAEPILLWGRPAAHISIGQGQCRAQEIVADPGVPIVRRALGGGAVWLDAQQHCAILIVPSRVAERDRDAFYARMMQPALATWRGFGLPAELVGRDVWVRGRKIAGGGAATLGQSVVLGFSFMLRFARSRFAAAIALPHENLRCWLEDGLAVTVTDWTSEAAVPSSVELVRTYRWNVRRWLGWCSRKSRLRALELTAIDELAGECDDDWEGGPLSRERDRIKLNARSYLFADASGNLRRAMLIVDNHVVRTAVHGNADD